MSHLSSSGHFHQDIATCIAEALAHFCDRDKMDTAEIDSFLFVGYCISKVHLSGIQRLNREEDVTRHRDILVQKSTRNGFEVISIDWKNL